MARDTSGYQVVRNGRETMIDNLSETELREELAGAIDLLEEMDTVHEQLGRLIRRFRDGDRFKARAG